MGVAVSQFGILSTGKPVDKITLHNASGLTVRLIQYGAAIQSLLVPAPVDTVVDVVLGYDSLDQYESPTNPSQGAVVGRHANRIGGASVELDGVTCTLFPNEGRNNLHSAPVGFGTVVWDYDILDSGESPAVRFSYFSPDGESGFPGNMRVTVTYSLIADGLRIDYDAISDQTTIINLTNHAYFNLAGQGEGSILNHVLTLDADSMTPVDAELIPDGRIAPVSGTPFDFSQAKEIGRDIQADDEQIRLGHGYDHHFVVRGTPGMLRPCATVIEPHSGRKLVIETTSPGVQFYTANRYVRQTGKTGAVYHPYCGFCLETQYHPDAMHHPNFPSTVFAAGEPFQHTTVFHFTA